MSRTLRIGIVKALPILLAAVATALVLLFLPTLASLENKPPTPRHTVPAPVTISTLQVASESIAIATPTNIAPAKRAIATPLEMPTIPSAPPSTAEPNKNNASDDSRSSTSASTSACGDSRRSTGTASTGTNKQTGTPPLLIKKVEPHYPERSRRMGQEGYVILRFDIDTKGRVLTPTIHHAEPQGNFERAALNAIKQWRFKAAQDQNGKPIPYHLQVRIDFRLD